MMTIEKGDTHMLGSRAAAAGSSGDQKEGILGGRGKQYEEGGGG